MAVKWNSFQRSDRHETTEYRMLTKTSAELTLFDRLSQLTFVGAVKLLGAKGSRLIAEGGKYDIDITTQVKFNRDRFQLALGGATAMPPRVSADRTDTYRRRK